MNGEQTQPQTGSVKAGVATFETIATPLHTAAADPSESLKVLRQFKLVTCRQAAFKVPEKPVSQSRTSHIKPVDVATVKRPPPLPPQTNRNGHGEACVAMFEKPTGSIKPVLCSFPGYEHKEVASVPLVHPNDFKYTAGSCELKKVDKTQQRSKLVPCPEALKLLESIDKPVSVLTICGPTRGGKSYILSRILGRLGAFKTSHTFRPQTYGVWMGTHYLDFGEFAMLLLDTEGTDAVGAENDDDISILLLATLLSSFIIYNSMKLPNKHDLQTMECFTRLSNAIAINSMKERVQESEYGDLRRLFPDFLWLLRDVTLELPENEKGQPVTTREFMLNEVFVTKKDVGIALESFFATVDCMTLCTPGDVKSLPVSDESSQDGPNHQFFQEVKNLIAYLHGKARAKNGFQKGERVDGRTLSMLVNSYLEAINNPNAKPCIESSWKSAVEMRCSQEIAKLVEEYEAEMQKMLTNKLPMEVAISDSENTDQPSLMQIHGDILRRMLDKLREATQYFMSADPFASATERMELSNRLIGKIIKLEQVQLSVGSLEEEKVVGGVVHRFLVENEKMSCEHCSKVFDEVSQQLHEQIKAAESNPSTTESLQDTMESKIEQLQADYFVEAVGPAKDKIFESKMEELKGYGFKVAGFQRMMNEVIDREALTRKGLLEELKASKAAAEEQHKTFATEQKKMRKEHEEKMKRVTDDLERQIRNEGEKIKELKGKDAIITQLKQEKKSLEEAASKQRSKTDAEVNALKQRMEKAEAELKQAEAAKKESEAALKQTAAEAKLKAAETAKKEAEVALNQATQKEAQRAKKQAEAQKETDAAKKQAEAAIKQAAAEVAQKEAEVLVAQKEAEAARKQAEAAKKQAEAARKQVEAAKKQAEARKQAEAAKKQAEAARKQVEAAKKQAEARKQAEAALKQAAAQPPLHMQTRKINLLDEHKKLIAMVWFNGNIPPKNEIKNECQRLILGAPRDSTFVWQSEEAWIKYFGNQLYEEGLVMLKKLYDIEPSDIVVHRK